MKVRGDVARDRKLRLTEGVLLTLVNPKFCRDKGRQGALRKPVPGNQ